MELHDLVSEQSCAVNSSASMGVYATLVKLCLIDRWPEARSAVLAKEFT
jgi:hypothetical protein